MTLRSRLSAAWKAFRQDDFPPSVPERFFNHGTVDAYPPVRLELQPNTTYHVSAPKSEAGYAEEMRAASRPSMADECEAMRLEQERSALTPDIANVELVKAPGIRRRKKLVSVPKE